MKKVHETKLKEIAAEVNRLANRNGGKITPEQVLDSAKEPDSPIHDCFEWDDTEAANRYRIIQARSLIQRVKIVYREDHRVMRIPAFVRNPDVESGEQGYVSVTRIRKDTEVSRDMLCAEFKRASGYLDRVRRLADYFDLKEDMDSFVRDFEILRAKANMAELTEING